MAVSGTDLAPEVWVKGVRVFKDEGYQIRHHIVKGDGHTFHYSDRTASLMPSDVYRLEEEGAYLLRIEGVPKKGDVKVISGGYYDEGYPLWKDVLRWVLQGLE